MTSSYERGVGHSGLGQAGWLEGIPNQISNVRELSASIRCLSPQPVVSTIDDNFPTFRFIYRKLTGRTGKLALFLLLALPVGTWGALRLSMLMAVRRAETLLARIKSLRVRESTFQDAKHLANQYASRVDYHNVSCDVTKCDFTIYISYGWVDEADRIHESLRSLGIRQFGVGGSVQAFNGRVMGTKFAIFAEARKGVPGGQWLDVDTRITDRFLRSDYSYGRQLGLEEHPNRKVTKPHLTTVGGGQVLHSAVTPDATADEKERAFDIRLSCLSSLQGCAELSDIAPSAWEDLLAMRKSQDRGPEKGGDEACSVRTLARLSRDTENVLLVEVKKVFPPSGEWGGTQDVEFQLLKLLKGKTSAHLARYPLDIVEGSPTADRRSPRLAPENFSPGKPIILFLRESELNFVPNPYCEVIPASSQNLAVVRQSIAQLEQGLPITALR